MDEIKVTLPVSQKEVVIRNYTTVADDENAQSILYKGVAANTDEKGKAAIAFPMHNVTASQVSYVERLTISIDGDTDVRSIIQDMRSKDYAFLSETVDSIVEEHSPKVKPAEKEKAKSLISK